MKALVQFICVLAFIAVAHGYFVTIDAHSEECFHERVDAKSKMSLIFEVAQGGFLDIDVQVSKFGNVFAREIFRIETVKTKFGRIFLRYTRYIKYTSHRGG